LAETEVSLIGNSGDDGGDEIAGPGTIAMVMPCCKPECCDGDAECGRRQCEQCNDEHEQCGGVAANASLDPNAKDVDLANMSAADLALRAELAALQKEEDEFLKLEAMFITEMGLGAPATDDTQK